MILDAPYPTDPRVTNEAKALISSGHEVYLFCLSFKNKFITNEIIEGINVIRFHCDWFTYKLSALAYTFPFYKWIMSKKIKEFINNYKIDVLHVHDIQIASSVYSANSKKKLDTVLDLHENRPEIMKYYKHVNSFLGKLLISPLKWKNAEEKYCKISNSVVVVTELAKKELIERIKIDKKKVIVFSNSVSKSFYSNIKFDQQIIKKYSKYFMLLYLGNTSERRGLMTVLKSIPKIIKTVPNFKFIIVGSSSFDNELLKTSKTLNILKYIDFEGWKNESLFPSYIKASNLAISPLLPNLHHHTTYANKIFQYMSLGCPILCSDVEAQKSLLNTHKVGLLFKAGDYEDLIKIFFKLYLNKDLRNKLSTNCIDAIKNHLNNDIISKNLVNYYNE